MCCCYCPPEGYVPLPVLSVPTAMPEPILVRHIDRSPHFERHLRSEVRAPIAPPMAYAHPPSDRFELFVGIIGLCVIALLGEAIAGLLEWIRSPSPEPSLPAIVNSGLDAIDQRSRQYIADVTKVISGR